MRSYSKEKIQHIPQGMALLKTVFMDIDIYELHRYGEMMPYTNRVCVAHRCDARDRPYAHFKFLYRSKRIYQSTCGFVALGLTLSIGALQNLDLLPWTPPGSPTVPTEDEEGPPIEAMTPRSMAREIARLRVCAPCVSVFLNLISLTLFFRPRLESIGGSNARPQMMI
jgi:hypothetical protein